MDARILQQHPRFNEVAETMLAEHVASKRATVAAAAAAAKQAEAGGGDKAGPEQDSGAPAAAAAPSDLGAAAAQGAVHEAAVDGSDAGGDGSVGAASDRLERETAGSTASGTTAQTALAQDTMGHPPVSTLLHSGAVLAQAACQSDLSADSAAGWLC